MPRLSSSERSLKIKGTWRQSSRPRGGTGKSAALKASRSSIGKAKGACGSLKLSQIAEGVEDATQAQWLSEHECRQAQAYHFARPMPADRISALLDSGERSAPYPVDTRIAA